MMCFFGYWFLGQPQIFANFAATRDFTNDIEYTGEYATPVSGPNLPFFCFFIIGVLWLFFESCVKTVMVKCRTMTPFEEPEVNEGLGTYFECVPNYQRRAAYAEEAYKQGKLNIRTMHAHQFESLRTTNGGKKVMEGPTSYNLMQDTRYLEGFCYDPV
jgi:hypothetical protein